MEKKFIKISGHATDLTGRTFGQLTVIGPVGRNNNRGIIWLCRCSCGNERKAYVARLLNGTSQFCASCLLGAKRRMSTVHGLLNSPAYRAYKTMTRRCNDSHGHQYHNYGGRGIRVCDEWRSSPKNFLEYVAALPNYGVKGRTLDRIDNNRGYEPGNVRWATKLEQERNTRRNHMITHDGRTQCITDWERECGLGRGTLTHRFKRGWSIEKALTAPLDRRYSRAKTKTAYASPSG